jgi:hypothetical protein
MQVRQVSLRQRLNARRASPADKDQPSSGGNSNLTNNM